MESKYAVEVVDPSGTLLAEVGARAKTRMFIATRNRAERIYLSFDLDDLEAFVRSIKTTVRDLFYVNRNEIRIRRGDKYLMGGQIHYLPGTLSVDQKTIEVRAVGFLELFGDRYTGASRVFTATDAGMIAKTLIDESQELANGNFGIGTDASQIQASVSRDRTYEYKNIKEAIIALSEVINGFDFSFTYDKKFYVWYPKIGADKSEDVQFEFPRNIRKLTLPMDATGMINQAIVRGAGSGVAQIVSVRDDLASQGAYFLRQKVFDYPDVTQLATLQQHGDEELRVFAQPVRLPQIEVDGNLPPAVGSYWIGDMVRVKILEGDFFSQMDGVFRIEGITIRLDENDDEQVTLVLQ